MFLTDQFRLLQQRLEDAIPAVKKAFLQQFYSQVCNDDMIPLNSAEFPSATLHL